MRSTAVSAGLHTVGFSRPSRIACAASSEPLPTRFTLMEGCSFWNAAAAASTHSFFSVL